MRRFPLVVTLCSLALIPLLAVAGHDDLSKSEKRDGKTTKIPNQYIVVLADDADADVVASALTKKHKGELQQTYKHAIKGFSATLSSDDAAALKMEPGVIDVVQDEEVFIDAKPVSQPAQRLPTGVNRINAENKANIGTGIEVAVIDTGIDSTHPDLKGVVLGGVTCVGGTPEDQNGHGTHVSGTIAALNNGIGVIGVSPGAKLWSVRVLNAQGAGSWSSIICGIDWVTARASRIKVANMSLGGTGSAGTDCNSSPLRRAICNSVAAGVTYVVAAGNESDDVKNHVPAAYPETIAVSALADSNGSACGGGASTSYGADDAFASFSNYATQPTDLSRLIGAPGVSIYSTWKGGGYSTISGTSMASPHVAGVAALYIKAHPGSTPQQVKAGLLAAAETGNISFNNECGLTGKSHTGNATHPEAVLRADLL